jgi:ATP-dependent Clp protease ATP-binding subunit ClpC
VFERFSEPARQAFVVAHEEARALGSARLGTEHVLLGLLADDSCVAGRTFESLGVSRREVRKRVVLLIRDDAKQTTTVEFSDAAKRLLELSLREALRCASPRIGTGHVALGMLGVRDSTAVQLLEELGVDPGTGRTRVLDALADGPEQPAAPQRSSSRPAVRLTPETRQLIRAAGRFGSTFVAGRFVSPNVLRVASATTRIVRQLGPRAGDGTPLAAAVCSVCGAASPGCGTLYAGPLGALVCERCARGSGTGDGP